MKTQSFISNIFYDELYEAADIIQITNTYIYPSIFILKIQVQLVAA